MVAFLKASCHPDGSVLTITAGYCWLLLITAVTAGYWVQNFTWPKADFEPNNYNTCLYPLAAMHMQPTTTFFRRAAFQQHQSCRLARPGYSSYCGYTGGKKLHGPKQTLEPNNCGACFYPLVAMNMHSTATFLFWSPSSIKAMVWLWTVRMDNC